MRNNLGRYEGRRFRRPPHLYDSGALCVAATSDWDQERHTTATAVAWGAHWFAAYTEWRMGGHWPTDGFVRRRNPNIASPPDVVTPASPTSDVEFVVGQTGEWIRNADTKTGLLLTGLTVLLAGISGHAGDLRAVWSANTEPPVAVWVLAGSVAFLAVAYGLLVAVLVPRTTGLQPSRYSWPWLATQSLAQLEALAPSTARSEALTQARTLAGIAARKYKFFALAVWASGASIGLFLIWSVLRG